MKYTTKELESFLIDLLMAACSGEEVIITRDGKSIARLVHRGPSVKRAPGRLGAISRKRTAPIRSKELSDLGFE